MDLYLFGYKLYLKTQLYTSMGVKNILTSIRININYGKFSKNTIV